MLFFKKELPTNHSLAIYITIYVILMQNEMFAFVQYFLSPCLCGFREGYSTQHALLSFVESCKKSLDNGGVEAAVMMDPSKAFDCLNHE